MARRLPSVPSEFQYLLPERRKKTIVIGEFAYELYPLVEGEVESLWSDLSSILTEVELALQENLKASTIGKSVEKARLKGVKGKHTPPSDSDFVALLVGAVKAAINKLFEERRIPKILARALDEDETYIRENLTIHQAITILAVLYEQNFSLEGLPEEIRKNSLKLLEKMGVKLTPGPTPGDEFTLFTLERLVESIVGTKSEHEAFDAIHQEALRRGFIKSSPSGESSKPLPTSTAGPENTSSEPENESAP